MLIFYCFFTYVVRNVTEQSICPVNVHSTTDNFRVEFNATWLWTCDIHYKIILLKWTACWSWSTDMSGWLSSGRAFESWCSRPFTFLCNTFRQVVRARFTQITTVLLYIVIKFLKSYVCTDGVNISLRWPWLGLVVNVVDSCYVRGSASKCQITW